MKKALMAIGIAAMAFALLIVIVSVAATNGAGPLTTEVTDAPVTTGQAEAPASPAVPEMKEGVYQVGVDVPAGRYKTPGAEYCYWARMRDDSGEFESLIANDAASGPGSITVKDGEFVKVSGECTWTLTP